MVAIWHYSDGGQRHGPVTAAELKAMADSGRLTPDSLVWKDGMSEWKPAKNVKGLFAAKPQPEDRPSKPEDRPLEHKPSSSSSTRKVILAIGAGFGGLFVFCCGGCAVVSIIGRRDPSLASEMRPTENDIERNSSANDHKRSDSNKIDPSKDIGKSAAYENAYRQLYGLGTRHASQYKSTEHPVQKKPIETSWRRQIVT